MDKYGLHGLENFIFKKIKEPFIKTQKCKRADIQGLEERYIEQLLDVEGLAPMVQAKVVDKLTDAIAEKVVSRIMVGAALGIAKTERENKEDVDFWED